MSLAASRDLRAGGGWDVGQRAKNALIRAAVVGLLGIADRLPHWLLFATCRFAGRLVAWTVPSLLRRAQARARAALPEAEALRVARECFANAGSSLATSLLLRRPDVSAGQFVRIDEAARRTLTEAGGAIVISAHLGPFELVAPAVAELGLATAIVVRESYDPGLDRHVDAHRLGRGVRVIHRGDPGAAARIVRALRSAQLVGVLPDLPARVESVPVELAGCRSEVPVGPARIALAAGVPLLCACLVPEAPGPRFRLEVLRIEARGQDPADLTQRVAGALSEAILRAPAWWLWMAAASPADLQKKSPTR